MNRLNWVQQSEDFKTEYHVLQWKTSHFHEPYARRNAGSMPKQPSAAAAAAAKEMQTEAEGLVLGLADKRKTGTRPGFGMGDHLAQGVSGEDRGRDGVSISAQGTRQQNDAGQTQAAVQSVSQAAQIQAAETVAASPANEFSSAEAEEERANRENTTVAQTGRGNIRNRLQESAKRLQEAYQRQKEKAAKLLPLKQIKEEKPKEKEKGTRMADKETMLSMQAENHYLLDSYDHNGNYSMLGK
ncbi:MAG: hypothetical protein HDR05_09670 [Lachnospiraceae bacterium]|nr:hypothetical protein [Lachnospiraceae bacterium]